MRFLKNYLRLSLTQNALQLRIFSFFFSTQQIWTNWQKLLVEFPGFFKLTECGSVGKSYVTNIYSNLKFRVWKHDIPYALEKIIMAEVSRHIKVSIWMLLLFFMMQAQSYTWQPNSLQGQGFIKVIIVFPTENVDLFTVARIHWIQKSLLNRNPETRQKLTENSRMRL